MATDPKSKTIRLACVICCPINHILSKKLLPPPSIAKNLGSCVDMIDSAAPALKPSNILSLIKFTNELSRNRKAIKQIHATANAVNAAMAAHLAGSPPDKTATVVPTIKEIAEVGPTATCFELVKNAKNKPPAKQQ